MADTTEETTTTEPADAPAMTREEAEAILAKLADELGKEGQQGS